MNSLPPSSAWSCAASHPVLHAGEVHVWRVHLDDTPDSLAEALSPAERVRAARFHFESDAARFRAGRGALRAIIADYLGCEARALEFTSGPHGKPELAKPDTTLRFNVSHSDDLMLVALAYGRSLGVDLECMRANVPFETLAEHYFEPEDAWRVRTLPLVERTRTFYEVWTCTEARLKASGEEIARGAKIVAPDRWSLHTLTPAEGFAAALAVEGGDFQLACWSWNK